MNLTRLSDDSTCIYSRAAILSSNFTQKQSLRVTIILYAVSAPLTSNAALLVSSKCSHWGHCSMSVDPDTTRLDLFRDLGGFVNVTAPDGCAQAHSAVVSAGNDIFLIIPGQEGNDRTWALLAK